MNTKARLTQTRASYILQLERIGARTVFRLHNLANGKRWEGCSWEELRAYLEQAHRSRLK